MKKLFLSMLLVLLTLGALVGCSDNVKFEKGILTDTSYESQFLNLRFELPDGYIMATEDDLKTMIAASNALVGIDVGDYDDLATVYEMTVQHFSGNPNVMVMAEKLIPATTSVSKYLEVLKEQLTDMPNMNYSFKETSEATIAGQTYTKLTALVDVFGSAMTQDYYLRKQGNRMIVLVFSYTDEATSEMQGLLNTFTAY